MEENKEFIYVITVIKDEEGIIKYTPIQKATILNNDWASKFHLDSVTVLERQDVTPYRVEIFSKDENLLGCFVAGMNAEHRIRNYWDKMFSKERIQNIHDEAVKENKSLVYKPFDEIYDKVN